MTISNCRHTTALFQVIAMTPITLYYGTIFLFPFLIETTTNCPKTVTSNAEIIQSN